jgi:septal ring-binding cell division protein DamX
VDAQYNLGVFYRDGQGVPANSELALKWFREAASNGDQVSADVVRNYEKFGWDIAADEIANEGAVEVGNPALDDSMDSVLDSSAARDVDPPPLTDAGDIPALETPGDESTNETRELDSAIASEQVEQVEQAQQAGEIPVTNAPTSAGQPLGEDWIIRRDPQHYTIQIIALLSPDKFEEFIENNSEWSPFAIYQQQWKGKPLYVLLQGDYADVEQARAAVAKFPTGLQKREELWIRKFVMVQGLLKEP